MSLKAFHIVFILISIGLCLFFGWWSMGIGQSLGESYRIAGVASLILGAFLMAYLVLFLKKINHLRRSE